MAEDTKSNAGTTGTAVPPANSADSDNQEVVGFFQEDYGTYSSMRLMCFLSLVAAIAFGLLTILLHSNGKTDGGNGILITFGFLIGAFAPKAVQKFAEQKMPMKK